MKSNPIHIAKQLGQSIAGSLGGEAMIELLFSFVLSLLPMFDDNPKFRVVQHILLYWPKAFYKSTLLWTFSETIPNELGIVDITSMSRESIFGSTDKNGNPIKPAFAGKSFIILTELTAFLGSGWNMKDMANTLNVVMESQPVSRRLLKLAQTEDFRVQHQVMELKKQGIRWDPKEGVMSYTPHVCVLAASRPLDEKYFRYLDQGGFLDRFHVISHKFDEAEITKNWYEHRRLDREALESLRQFNKQIKEVQIGKLKMPTEEFMKPIYDDLESIVDDEIAADPRLRKEAILNPRTKGDLIRELVAHAFIRTASENEFKEIDELEYDEADREFVRQRLSHFIEFKVHPIFVQERTMRIQKRRPRDQVKLAVLDLLEDGKERHYDDISAHLDQRGVRVSQATIYNALKELIEKDKKIIRTGKGFYKKEDRG